MVGQGRPAVWAAPGRTHGKSLGRGRFFDLIDGLIELEENKALRAHVSACRLQPLTAAQYKMEQMEQMEQESKNVEG